MCLSVLHSFFSHLIFQFVINFILFFSLCLIIYCVPLTHYFCTKILLPKFSTSLYYITNLFLFLSLSFIFNVHFKPITFTPTPSLLLFACVFSLSLHYIFPSLSYFAWCISSLFTFLFVIPISFCLCVFPLYLHFISPSFLSFCLSVFPFLFTFHFSIPLSFCLSVFPFLFTFHFSISLSFCLSVFPFLFAI
jgi:hypothetical protein